MIKSVLVGAVSVTSLFMGNMDTEAPMPDEASVDSTYNISEKTDDKEALNSVSNNTSLLYMTPAAKESDEAKEVRRSVRKELKEREIKKAEKEADRLTKEKIEKTKKDWNKNFEGLNDGSKAGKFIDEIAKESISIAHDNGLYPSVMIAQAGLESNWGLSSLARKHNNLMGTKGAWKGKSTKMKTKEHVNGGVVTINAGFSVYDSWGESLSRYGQLLRNGLKHSPNFYSGTWKENTDSYKDATAWLQGRYATDRNYAGKLNNTISAYHLERFDEIEPLEDKLESIVVDVIPEDVFIKAPEGIYEVKAGDSLLSIAVMHDLTVEELLELNGLDTPEIEEKQWLSIKEGNKIKKVEDLLLNEEQIEDGEDLANVDGYEAIDDETLEKFGLAID